MNFFTFIGILLLLTALVTKFYVILQVFGLVNVLLLAGAAVLGMLGVAVIQYSMLG